MRTYVLLSTQLPTYCYVRSYLRSYMAAGYSCYIASLTVVINSENLCYYVRNWFYEKLPSRFKRAPQIKNYETAVS